MQQRRGNRPEIGAVPGMLRWAGNNYVPKGMAIRSVSR